MKHKIALLSLIGLFLFSGTLQAQKEFPVWDEGVFAEVAKRHGEKASARLRDVYQFIIVHLNEPVEMQLEAVNDYMNDLTWIADSELWKQPDYWATPFETITTFGGDCEDIAIAKYLVLLLLGVPDERLGFAHVINQKKEHHMVLIYKASDEEEAMVLDNEQPDVKPAGERSDLIAVYIFRNDGTTFIIKDEGNGKRSLKNTIEKKRLEKWLTAKKRARENTESLIPFNEGRPFAPDWLSDVK